MDYATKVSFIWLLDQAFVAPAEPVAQAQIGGYNLAAFPGSPPHCIVITRPLIYTKNRGESRGDFIT